MPTTASRRADPAQADAPPESGPTSVPEPDRPRSARAPTAAVAARLIGPAREAGAAGLLQVAASEGRAEEIGRALRQLAPEVEVLVLPPWDCLPYDRASPSREVMGRRMAVLARLAVPAGEPRVLVASPDALLQLVPPASAFEGVELRFRPGEIVDAEALQAFADRAGYLHDDVVREPGEIVVRGAVVDVWPAAATAPARLSLDAKDRIEAIHAFDPVTQRTDGELEAVVLGPTSEVVFAPDAPHERPPGFEHRMPEFYDDLQSVFDLIPQARLSEEEGVQARRAQALDLIAEAHEARATFGEGEAPPLPADRLYLTEAEWAGSTGKRRRAEIALNGVEPMPRFAVARNPGRAFCDFVQARRDEGLRVAVTGTARELRAVVRALKRGLDVAPEPVAGWAEALAAPAGALLAAPFDLEAGFVDPEVGVALIAAADVLGARVAEACAAHGAEALLGEPALRLGDVVIHEDHGVGVLRALERLEVDGRERDTVRLEYHGGATLLAGVEEFGRLWRYGSAEEAVSLDRLNTDGWNRRRAEISVEIDAAAARLVELARAREAQAAEPLVPPAGAYARFAARFPFPETPDQRTTIDAVLADLASGRPMNRLVCGDVGFGKTEVALRAAAAVALAGRQVAVVAPTTVLVRQHAQAFERRFAGTGIKVAQLSRLVSTQEARAVKAGLASGEIGVVVGTHAVASRDVRFADLGLLVVDEEQRFGARLKASLQALAPHAHRLTLTATPIPRTLQMAMVGLQEVSVLASPPARRRPIRTFLAPFDGATVRTALLRERRRGGQSFLVAPQIADLEPLWAKLAELAPELSVVIAHGELPAEEVDRVMVDFADGRGDVLLATNIIESGLDVPRANTMLIWRADRFGLAQLHQLRGRVGRGRAQGVAYLLTDPAEEIAEGTRARLTTLEAYDRLGSGLAISARDLDLRGAGDLVGDDQAGHLRLIGASLYQRLLTRAVRLARGEVMDDDWTPELRLELTGAVPVDYVPEAEVRIDLYARLSRLTDPTEVDAFAEEAVDRFGEPPPEMAALLDLARLQLRARAAGVARADAGPKALALSFRDPHASARLAAMTEGDDSLEWREDRLIWRRAVPDALERVALLTELLDRMAPPSVTH